MRYLTLHIYLAYKKKKPQEELPDYNKQVCSRRQEKNY